MGFLKTQINPVFGLSEIENIISLFDLQDVFCSKTNLNAKEERELIREREEWVWGGVEELEWELRLSAWGGVGLCRVALSWCWGVAWEFKGVEELVLCCGVALGGKVWLGSGVGVQGS